MMGMMRDVRNAVRGLLRRPAFTVLAGLTLAVGIGANTAIFSVVDGILLDPLPLPEADRLLSYNHTAPDLGVPILPHSEASYLHYAERARAIQSLAVYTQINVTVVTDGEPRRFDGAAVSEQFFDVSGVAPILGRGFAPGEDRVGAEPVAVLSRGVWEQSFGADPGVVGRLVDMNGTRRRVIGVMDAGADLLDAEVWVPLSIDASEPETGSFSMLGFARLAPGATMESAQAEMSSLFLQFAEAHPDELSPSTLEESGLRADVKPLKELAVENLRQTLWILLGTVGFVLLIACANVANLFLVRAEGRQREQAVRTALGASRADVVRQYLAESVTLGLAAGAVGLVLGSVGLKALLAVSPVQLPTAMDIGVDGSVLLFTATVSVLAGVFFGLFPASTYARPDLVGTMSEGNRSATAGRERHRARNGLVVAQVALALVLLVGAGLMLRSFSAIQGIDLGFESEGRLTFRIALPSVDYPLASDVQQFQRLLDERLAGLPGVEAVGMVTALPLVDHKSAQPMESEDRPDPPDELGTLVERRQVTPGYFEAMGISLLDGRDLTWDDGADRYPAVVASEALARAFWPNERAVGKRIRGKGDDEMWWEVVGVVEDVRIEKVQEDPLALVYVPVVQGNPDQLAAARSVDVVIRGAGDPLSRVPAVRDAVRAADPRLPIIQPRTVDSVVEESMAATSFTVLLLGLAAGVALLLGTVGIYGVVSYTVSRRTKEIGVRLALGAQQGSVLGDVLRQGVLLAGTGVVIGLAGALALSRVLETLLYGVSATDPVTFLGTGVGLGLVAVVATWVPARRAARVDPVTALRAE